MFKQIITLFRGVAEEQEQAFTDRHALLILKQQIRDSARAIDAAQRAVAIAIAQNEQEVQQHNKMVAKIAELEERTMVALEQGKDKLAGEAAEMIAVLETERDASKDAQDRFSREITRLKGVVRNAETRLKELQRGQRLANATNYTQKLRKVYPSAGMTDLRGAEQTLARLKERQQQIDLTANAISEMEATSDPSSIVEKLAEAGCGAPLRTSSDDVLARLKKQMKKSGKTN